MIISFRHKFIYLAVPKTASISIRAALEPHGAVTVGYACENDPAIAHHEFITPPEFSSYFTFASVRNPYRRALSEYLYCQHTPPNYLHALSMALDFPDWLFYCIARNKRKTQSEMLDGLRIDAIVKCGHDLAAQLRALPPLAGLDINLPTENTSTYERPWREYYTGETVQLVKKWAAKDFVAFGYSNDFLGETENV